MKMRIPLVSFEALAFAVIPVTRPPADPPAPLPVGESEGPTALDRERRMVALYAGCSLPNSLAEWFEDSGALVMCGAATAESTCALESGLLKQRLARRRRCPSRRLRRELTVAGEILPVAGRDRS